MKRNMGAALLNWKKKSDRMPLLLYGVRQSGKTWLLQEFGRTQFAHYIYINFERMPLMRDYFEGDLAPAHIIRRLEQYFHAPVNPKETLLIFDEIQSCERALTSLKYFCEEAPEYYVIGAGSLLGVSIARNEYSFPVGKVDIRTLHPMRFDEFLAALSMEPQLDMIREHFDSMRAMPESTHNELMRLFKLYLAIGGMPAAVNRYIADGSTVNVPDVQHMIINSYIADMSKYVSESDALKIRAAYRSLPAQLSKDNHKFQYKMIRKGATSTLFGDAINWLTDAQVVLRCDRVTVPEIPLKAFIDVSAFKLYMSDTGLLSALCELMPDDILNGNLSPSFLGALTENYIAQTFNARSHPLYYWTGDNGLSEIDFCIRRDDDIVPVEVKPSHSFHSRSLKQYREKYSPKQILHISGRNFGTNGDVASVPLYAAFLL